MKSVNCSLMLLFSICFFIALTPQNVSAGGPLRQGIDCQCTRTDDYSRPAAPRRAVNGRLPAVYFSGSDPSEGQSSANNPSYRISVGSTGGTINLYVTRSSDNASIFQATELPSNENTNWGFSPDEHRFVYTYVDISGNYHVKLHRLDGSQPGTPVREMAGTLNSTVLFSPRGKYLLYADLTGSNTLRFRVADSSSGSLSLDTQISFVNIPAPLDPDDEETVHSSVTWGFSPDRDDNTFTYSWAKTATRVERRVVYLPGGQTVHDSDVDGSSIGILFSPAGKYLFFASQYGDNHVSLNVMDASTGEEVYSDSFTFNVPSAGGRRFGVAGWGFSPDNLDAGFSYAYVTGSDSVNLKLARMDSGESVMTTSITEAAYWRFSPCGDVMGIVRQVSGGYNVSLHRTINGEKITSPERESYSQEPVKLLNTQESHFVQTASGNHYLADNEAGKACPVPDSQPPSWPSGAKLTFSDVTENSIKISWPEATDNTGVTAYRVQRNGSSQTLPGSSRSHTFSGLSPETLYTFQVQAGDAAGNWSPPLSGEKATNPLLIAPEWPSGSSLTVMVCTGPRMYFTWTAAEGDFDTYRLFHMNETVAEVGSGNLSFMVEGVEIDTTRRLEFRVEAGYSGHDVWTSNGPRHNFWQEHAPGPCWHPDAALDVTNVSARRVSLRWPEALNPEDVVRYEIFRIFTPMGTVYPDNTPPVDGHFTADIDDLWWDTEYSFRVAAYDSNDNPGVLLVSETVRTDDREHSDPPSWPSGSMLTASDIGTSFINLSWDEAEHPDGVEAYRIFIGGRRIATVPSQILSYRVDNLSPDKTYLFRVEAGDQWENWSDDGPSVTAATADGPPDQELPDSERELLADFHIGPMNWWEGEKAVAEPDVSADGRYVAFVSRAENLIPGLETNDVKQIYLFDRSTGELELVSRTAGGRAGDGPSYAPAVSGDGRFVAFVSESENLDPRVSRKDFPADPDIFVHDRETGQTVLVSIDMFGRLEGQSGMVLDGPNISEDGRFIVFRGQGLVPGLSSCIVVHDRQLGRTIPVGVDARGEELGYGIRPVISGDGRYVAFRGGPVYVIDLWSGRIIEAAPAHRYFEWQPVAMSADGSILVYEQTAEEDSYGDENDLFAVDLHTGETERISFANTTSHTLIESVPPPAVSGNGRFISFISHDHTLAPCATRWEEALYLHDRWEQSFEIIEAWSDDYRRGLFPSISCDGQVIVYQNISYEDSPTGAEYGVQIYAYQRGGTDIQPPCWPDPWFEAAVISGRFVTLEWNEAHDNRDVDGYLVFLGDVLIGETPGSTTHFTVTGLEPETEYIFGLQAVDSAGNLSRPLSLTVTTPDLDYMPGDVNADGVVDLADAVILLQYTAGLRDLTEEQKMAGNITGHEDYQQVGIADALTILRILVNLSLP